VFIEIFDSSLLVIHFLFTLGIAMIYVRYSSSSFKNYTENILFNNDKLQLELYTSSTGNIPYIIPYSSISYLRTYKKDGGPDVRDLYSLEIIETNGASFWITGFEDKPDELIRISNEIAVFTGLEIKDSANIGTEHEALKIYTLTKSQNLPQEPFFVQHSSNSGKEIIKLMKAKTSIFVKISILTIFLFFFTVPFYIRNIFIADSTPQIVHYFSIFFIILWIGILISAIIISIKDYQITLRPDLLKIKVKLKFAPLSGYVISIPANQIKNVRTNRIEYGTINLSLEVSDQLALNKKPGIKFVNLSLYSHHKSNSSSHKNEITLWEIKTGSKKGYSPDIFDLQYIEYIISTKLKISDH